MRATRSPWRGARFAVFLKNVPAVASTRPKPADVMPLGRRVCNCLGLAHRVPVNRNRNGIEIERGGLPGKLWERPQRLSQYLAGRKTRIWRLEPAGHHGG